jgi:hypothetical protein
MAVDQHPDQPIAVAISVLFALNSVAIACHREVARILPGRSDNSTLIGLAQTSRRLDQRVEHLRQIESRAGCL